MKQTLIVSFLLAAAAFLVPLLAAEREPLPGVLPMGGEISPPLQAAEPSSPPPSIVPAITPAPLATMAPPLSVIPPKPEQYRRDADTAITIYHGGQVVSITLRELLQGILTSEMPYSYPDEALKAQVVAARTFALYCLENSDRHENADLCSNSKCCLAYKPLAELAAAWEGEDYAARVSALVDATDGQVLTYDGGLCQAVFFAVSSGYTENAGDVWGRPIPYLTSVSSTWDASSEDYAASVLFTAAQARERLLGAWPDMVLDDSPELWVEGMERSPAGGVLYMEIGGVAVSGTDIRTVFGLASHNFNLHVSAREISFDTRGHGHGVGLSQYGAGDMARNGSDYGTILTHYYQGAVLGYLG